MSLSSWKESGQFLTHKDHAIFYRAQGAGDTALLCIHGFPTASWDFEPMWPALCRRFARVLALDMIGFGFSGKPRNYRYSLMDQADIQEALLRRLGVRRVHILAHDYGVSVAQEMLARQLERRRHYFDLRSVVLLNGGLFPETHRARFMQKVLNSPIGALASLLLNERSFGRSFPQVFGPRTRPGLIELHDFWQLIAHNNGQRIAHKLMRYIDERRRNRERWVGALQKTAVPLRLINGPLDPVSGAHMAERYCELVPRPDVILLSQVGHYPQVEAPERVLAALFEFHERLEQAAAPVAGGA